MSKYVCEIIKELNRLFEVQCKEYYESLYLVIKDYYSKGARITIGKQWVKIYDSQNGLLLFEERPLSLKAFLKYCEDNGRNFKKKI